MNKERIRKWLNDWIVISHELTGLDKDASKCSIAMPADVAATICSIGVFESEQDYYKYNTGSDLVDVNPVIGSQISISITRHER